MTFQETAHARVCDSPPVPGNTAVRMAGNTGNIMYY